MGPAPISTPPVASECPLAHVLLKRAKMMEFLELNARGTSSGASGASGVESGGKRYLFQNSFRIAATVQEAFQFRTRALFAVLRRELEQQRPLGAAQPQNLTNAGNFALPPGAQTSQPWSLQSSGDLGANLGESARISRRNSARVESLANLANPTNQTNPTNQINLTESRRTPNQIPGFGSGTESLLSLDGTGPLPLEVFPDENEPLLAFFDARAEDEPETELFKALMRGLADPNSWDARACARARQIADDMHANYGQLAALDAVDGLCGVGDQIGNKSDGR